MQSRTRYGQPPRRPWRVLPSLVVAVLAAGLLIGDFVLRQPGPPTMPTEDLLPDTWGWLCAIAVFVQAGALLLRYRWPGPVLLAVAALDVLTVVLSAGELSIGTPAVMVAAFTLWQETSISRASSWLACVALPSAAVTFIALGAGETAAAQWSLPLAAVRAILAFAAPAVVAELLLSRRQAVEALRERAILAEREQLRSAREAVQQERALMARELHDIAAHHLSGIIVSAQAADSLLQSEPDQARGYLRTVKTEAQRTLANLRQTVGLLRDNADGELSPVLAIGDIATLVESLRSRGTLITLREEGEPVALGPLAEIAAFRMVQESLTNARSHAPGAECTVIIRYADQAAEITVTNGPSAIRGKPEAGGGHGLLGMRERASLVGGRLEIGATADGGWTNVLELPSVSSHGDDPEPVGGDQ